MGAEAGEAGPEGGGMMYCELLQDEVDEHRCFACWGDFADGLGTGLHRQCRRENLREQAPVREQVSLYGSRVRKRA